MEKLEEYLLSKYFSSFGYIVAVFYIPVLVTFLGFTGQLRTSERRRFRCDVDPGSRDYCLVKYDEQYNSPFPLYGFVLLCFVSLVVVCIAYSWCFAKSRVDELEAALKPDVENPRRRSTVGTRRVFCFYVLHLLVRLVLGILFTVLQNCVFYPAGFPTEFVCVSLTVKPTVNSTYLNVTKDDASAINCVNSVGSDNAICAKGIFIVNILFAFLVFGEMCYLLVKALKSKEFTFDSEFCKKHFFNKSGPPVTLRESIIRRKRQIREDTELLPPLIDQNELSNKALDETFVHLVIYTGRAEHKFSDTLERHEIFDIYLKPQEESVAIKKLEELFLPNKDNKDPRKILVVGRPGIGKSLLCTKLERDWSKGELLCGSYKSFEHLFLFQFRWFNTETSEKISLKELLSRVHSEGSIDNEVFQDVLDDPEKVLLVFDGLDEFKHHRSCLEDERAHAGNSATEKMPFSALYVKLVKGKQLSGATVLTTCRPNVVQSVAGLSFDRMVEIMGFTPKKVEEYVQKFCAHDTKTMNRIWGHISGNHELLSLCYIPVNSFIICSLLEKLIALHEQDSENSLPTTSTEVYEGALRLFIFKHHPEFKGKPLTKDYLMGDDGFSDSIKETLSQLGSLAKTGIEERRLMFESTEVQRMENCGLLNRMPDREVSPFRFTSNFCFIHLTLQELLAARDIAKMAPSDLSAFIYSNASDPKWHLVIQFVAGLLRGLKNEAVSCFVNLLCDSLTEKPPDPLRGETKEKALLMMKCLYEYNDEATVVQAASELQKSRKFDHEIDLSSCQVTPIDCAAILYFAKHIELTKLNLESNSITDQGVPHLCRSLKHVELTELNIGANMIGDRGVSHLCDAMKNLNCTLTKLNLGINNITDQGVSHICSALKDVNCKLTTLNLSSNNIKDQGLSELRGVLKDVNCKLTKLHLANNNITDQGLWHLCDALKEVNCKLTQLNLSDNKITNRGITHLCSALKHINCKLVKLNLSANKITDYGVSQLCGALKNVNCNLNDLNLNLNHNITDQGASYLSDALKNVNCKLIKLDIGANKMTAHGNMKLFALRHTGVII